MRCLVALVFAAMIGLVYSEGCTDTKSCHDHGVTHCGHHTHVLCNQMLHQCECTTASVGNVLSSECTGTNSCPGAENSVCKEDSCTCEENYKKKNDVCTLTVGGTTYTASGEGCDGIGNAECDTDAGKCKCSPGYVMSVEHCAAENAANTMGYGTVTLVIFLFLTLINILG